MRLSWTLASALLCSCSPFGGGAFTCETSDQCTLAGAPGMCQSTGMCSYADSSCAPSGQRYGGQAGGLSGTCVGGDASPDGSGPPPVDIAHDTIPATNDAACMIQGLDFCATGMEPGGPLDYSTATTINTSTAANGGSPLCRDYAQDDGGPQACLIVVSSLAISSGTKVTFTGDRPLVIAVSGTITISGTLDVSSHGGTHGPGASSNMGCNTGAMKATDNPAGASGGAGGTFANYGGDSGTGDTGDQQHKSPQSKAGSIIDKPTFVRGGCKGLDGGNGGLGGGGAGTGGGGVWLYANDIEIPTGGAINAGGAGGSGGPKESGGGGAGSGGYIRLIASTATIAGTLAANGGGGGQGGGTSLLLGVGGDGDNANVSDSAAHGGNDNPVAGGHGGDGSTNGQASDGQDSTSGAGGGGGGQGYIVVSVDSPTLTGSTISPPLTP